jgi:hypothetical protein
MTRGDRKLRKWTLPLAARDRVHAFDVVVGQSRGVAPGAGAREITVFRDADLLGVAVDAESE